ncbi:MAG TPA: hypothetical protein VG433_06335, partial [Pirellulales bacterium]|nr:hypothetical protein [Pirellulales bacterium]
MAAIQGRNGISRILFRYGGKQHSLPVGKVTDTEADQWQAKVEHLLMRLRQRLTEIPPGISITDFLLFDGRPPVDPEFMVRKETTFSELKTQYLATVGNGSIEANTLATARIHLAHLETTLGKRFLLSGLSLRKLQSHVDRRQADAAPVTIGKEIATFRAAWNWA